MNNGITELATAISKLSPSDRAKMEPAFQKVCACSNRRRRVLKIMEEALGQLRLNIQYLMFDLHATRKERDTYRDMLQIHPEDAVKPLDDRL